MTNLEQAKLARLSLPIVFVGLTIAVLFHERHSAKVRQSAVWIPIQATVQSTNVEKVESVSGSGTTSGTVTVYYELVVRYRYAVDGVYHSSSKFALGSDWLFRTRDSAQRRADKLARKGTAQAFYNPDAPEQAVLFRSSGKREIWPYLVFAVIYLIIVGVFVYAGWYIKAIEEDRI